MALPARIQVTSGTTGGTFPTSLASSAFSTIPVTGNVIVVGLLVDGLATSQATTMTDAYANTYLRVGTSNINAVDQVDLWIGRVLKTGPSFTVTGGNLANTTAAIITEEWSGLLASYIATASASNNSGTSTAVATASTASPQSEAVVFSVAGATSSSVTYSLGSGFSNLTQVVSSPSKLAFESQIITTGGNFTGAFTLSPGNSWVVTMGIIPLNGSAFQGHLSVGDGMSRAEVAN